MSKVLLCVLVVVACFGCRRRPPVQTVGEVVLPDGTKGFVLRCDATQTSCYQQAGGYCPTGYTISEENGMDHSQGGVAANGFRLNASHESKREVGMLIKCKPADAPAAPRDPTGGGLK